MPTTLEEVIDRQRWLEPISTGLQQVASAALDQKGSFPQQVRNFLHGTWLGHPLHPVLTDVPIGAWTASTILDIREMITGNDRLQAGTDATIGIGLLGAAGAAVTGLNDWRYTSGSARRVGVVHGLLNMGAVSLFLASWLLRRAGRRTSGQAASLLGYGAAVASAYLGGTLVYDQKIGTDHAPVGELPEDFTAVMAEDELPEGEIRRVSADGASILLVRKGEEIFALAETCAHMGGPLSEGRLEGSTVVCPWHGSRFSLETGQVIDGPSAFPQPTMETRVRNGQIEVRCSRSGVA